MAFSLFIEIEKMVRVLLPKQALKTESDQDLFKRTVHNNILKNEEVQFYSHRSYVPHTMQSYF